MILGCGIDLVYIPRMEQVCQRWGERFLSRVFTSIEQDYCYRHGSPFRHLSGRFAAKEALIKAMGGEEPARWTEMEVVLRPEGAPEMRVHGRTEQALRERGVDRVFLSISHDHHYSVAMVCLSASVP